MPVTRFAAIAALAVASVGIAHAATDSSGVYRPDAPTGLTRAEVEADLALWQRAGLAHYTNSEDSSATLSPQYQRQMAQYQQWRSGPEFRAEVQRHGGTTIAGKPIGQNVSQY